MQSFRWKLAISAYLYPLLSSNSDKNSPSYFAGASQRRAGGSRSRVESSSNRHASCSRDEKLYFPHERNCDMYFQCENGTLREGVCPDGLVFDDKQPPETLRCDLPFDIDCSYRSGLRKFLIVEYMWNVLVYAFICSIIKLDKKPVANLGSPLNLA